LSLLSRLTPNDLERLSAYVDGALTPRERSVMDARLETDINLQQALAELRSVKDSLAGLPEYRLPRNFILREADVRRRTPRPAFPALRFATIVAGGLFVLTTAVRWMPSSGMALACGLRLRPTAQAEFGAAASREASFGPRPRLRLEEGRRIADGGSDADGRRHSLSRVPARAHDGQRRRCRGPRAIDRHGGPRSRGDRPAVRRPMAPRLGRIGLRGAHAAGAPPLRMGERSVRFCAACGHAVEERLVFGRTRTVCPPVRLDPLSGSKSLPASS
jgi:hypothetical protein